MEEHSSGHGLTKVAMVYGVEDKLRLDAALVVSFQQVASMMVGVITPALLLSNILHFSTEDKAYLVSMALLAAAIGTFMQTAKFGFIGSGLLSVTGTSFAFLEPLIHAGNIGGLPLMFGMCLCTAPIVLCFAPFLPRLRPIFSPLVSGVVVLLVGLSILPKAMKGVVDLPGVGAPVWSGGAVAVIVIGVVIAAQSLQLRWARLASVLIGVAAGYLVCACFGWLHLPPSAGFLTVPHILKFGFAFSPELVVPFLFIYLVSLLEALGDMTATAQLSGLDTVGSAHSARMRGGVLSDGLNCIFSALLGSFPSTCYAQNNGVIQITGVASRHIGKWMAAIMAICGLCPFISRWFTAMPPPVLSGLSLLLFGLVAVSGLRLILSGGLPHRDALIVAISLGVGIGVGSQPDWVKTLPSALHLFLESGISAGGMVALFLNIILPPAVTNREEAKGYAEAATAPTNIPAAADLVVDEM